MKKILLALLILVALYLVGTMVLVPSWLEQSLQKNAAEALGQKLQIGKIWLNPLNSSVQMEQVVLLDTHGLPQLSVPRVQARLGFWGFWARTGHLSSLSLLESGH